MTSFVELPWGIPWKNIHFKVLNEALLFILLKMGFFCSIFLPRLCHQGNNFKPIFQAKTCYLGLKYSIFEEKNIQAFLTLWLSFPGKLHFFFHRKLKWKAGNHLFSHQLNLHTSTDRRAVRLIREIIQELKTMIKLYGPYVPPPGKALKASHEIHSPSEISKSWLL